jgi:hypothetical protein
MLEKDQSDITGLPTETSLEEYPYQEIRQYFSDHPKDIMLIKPGENVLDIQYEYIIEFGNGVRPRPQILKESIE